MPHLPQDYTEIAPLMGSPQDSEKTPMSECHFLKEESLCRVRFVSDRLII